MNVIGVGSSVVVGDDIPAEVTAVCIRMSNHVTYEVSFWSGREHKCVWVEQTEVRVTSGARPVKIGFTTEK